MSLFQAMASITSDFFGLPHSTPTNIVAPNPVQENKPAKRKKENVDTSNELDGSYWSVAADSGRKRTRQQPSNFNELAIQEKIISESKRRKPSSNQKTVAKPAQNEKTTPIAEETHPNNNTHADRPSVIRKIGSSQRLYLRSAKKTSTQIQGENNQEPSDEISQIAQPQQTEVASSVIPNNTSEEMDVDKESKPSDTQNEESPIPVSEKKYKRKSRESTTKASTTPDKSKKSVLPKVDTSGWSEARRRAYAVLNTNPNGYYYRFNAPGEEQKQGSWSPSEKQLFFKRMKEVGIDYHWGIFSMGIPGRVGYQCANFYRKLLKDGELKDDSYRFDDKGEPYYVGKNDHHNNSNNNNNGQKKSKNNNTTITTRSHDNNATTSNEVSTNSSENNKSASKKKQKKKHNKENSKKKTAMINQQSRDTVSNSKHDVAMTSQQAVTNQSVAPSPPKKLKQSTLSFFMSKKNSKPVEIPVRSAEEIHQAREERKQQRRDEKARKVEEWRQKQENKQRGKEIIPGLFLGNKYVAQNLEWLQENRVAFILNVTREIQNFFEKSQGDSQDSSDNSQLSPSETTTTTICESFPIPIQYKKVRLEDSLSEDLKIHFMDCCDFIANGLEEGKGVLVHCAEGRSRSVSFIAAYLMLRCDKSLKDCIDLLTEKSPDLNINDGFKRQLMDLEKSLKETSSMDFFKTSDRKAKNASTLRMSASNQQVKRKPRKPKATTVVSPTTVPGTTDTIINNDIKDDIVAVTTDINGDQEEIVDIETVSPSDDQPSSEPQQSNSSSTETAVEPVVIDVAEPIPSSSDIIMGDDANHDTNNDNNSTTTVVIDNNNVSDDVTAAIPMDTDFLSLPVDELDAFARTMITTEDGILSTNTDDLLGTLSQAEEILFLDLL